MKQTVMVIVLACFPLLSACAPKQNNVVQIPEPLEEIQEARQPQRTNGSLWSVGTGSLFEDHKARDIGDLVTIVIAESSSATKQATTEADRGSTYSISVPNFFGLENSELMANSNTDLENLLNANFDSQFEGEGRTVRSGDLTASLSAQVIDVYPNGNFKIRGGKEVMVNNEVQIIYLSGIVRPVDIAANNTIDSNKILNARITYTGRGPVADNQEPGWLGRTIQRIWPF